MFFRMVTEKHKRKGEIKMIIAICDFCGRKKRPSETWNLAPYCCKDCLDDAIMAVGKKEVVKKQIESQNIKEYKKQ